MEIPTKEKIILATLDLAAEYGLKSLSMSQIAEKVGIKKPSLYNHFDSKEALIKEMYEYIRGKSKMQLTGTDQSNTNKSAYDLLYDSVMNYKNLVFDKNMFKFYKVIYAERTTNKEAAEIMTNETDKMIEATKKVFEKLNIDDVNTAATSFAMTIHGLMDYELDAKMASKEYDKDAIEKYIKWFLNNTRRKNEK